MVVADEDRKFAFERDRPRGSGVMRWSYLLEPAPSGTLVTESFEQVRTAPTLAILAANLTTGVPWNDREAVNVANMQTTCNG